MESKSEKFVRLASARTNKSIASIRSIRKLANRNHYQYTDEQVSEIIKALKAELEMLKHAFNSDLSTKVFKLSNKKEVMDE